MQEWNVIQQDKIRLHGRRNRECKRFSMDWTGSGISFSFRGTHAEVLMDADNTGKEQWVLFELDGIPSSRIRLRDGSHWYTILDSRGHLADPELICGCKRTIHIYKESQAHYGETSAFCYCDRVRIDGDLCSLPEKRRIEFIGDSLTSGEGAISPKYQSIGSDVSIDEWSTHYYSWAGYAARMLDIDAQVISQGGFGVFCGWNNDMLANIPRLYDRVCGIIQPPFANARGASQPYEFSFNPNLIIINLGTNDASAFFQPPWQHPISGQYFKQHRVDEENNPDSQLFLEKDADKVTSAIVDFVTLLAEKNPGKPILWIYGMMGHGLWPIILKATACIHEMGITGFDALLLPEASPSELGANSHPLAVSHEICAKAVVERVRQKGWLD